jgi:hypothetical protein
MSWFKKLVWMVPTVALCSFQAGDADACGGCFVPPEENTQVTGHRMLLSVGMTQTTLYDQIEYDGDPAEFAWVLPIKGQAGLGVSSDLIFNQLGFDTTVEVRPPPLNCPVYEGCFNEASDGFGSASASSGAGGAGAGGVNVIAQEVVGPYETVQLEATDPNALNTWLGNHGYNIPADIQPIINSYVAESFNFLAIKLVPGVGTDKMQPIRITTDGASPGLPLRMVAAGTGATTTVTLYVVGEGRYEPSNFPSFTIPEDGVVWNWDSYDSNYEQLRQQAYAASNGYGWLVEGSRAYNPQSFTNTILNIVDFSPGQSGYGDGDDWQQAQDDAQADLDVLFAGLDPASVTVTRLRAELSRPALATDMQLAASSDQGTISNVIQTTKFAGTPPACPPPPDCGDDWEGGNGSPVFGGPFTGSGDQSGQNSNRSGSCAVGNDDFDDAAFGASVLMLMLGLAQRRRRRRRH